MVVGGVIILLTLLFWIAPMVVAYRLGLRLNRPGLALALAAVLGWIGVIIAVSWNSEEPDQNHAPPQIAACPFCQAPVRLGANLCPHCQRELPSA
ncbi:MAG: hypothetical protein C7B45_08360 [Sulfobacillus acidophilus]|uniref:Zinc ribbon domain-containing protein n=1 Tax=Sulfobacillus acidophilus TaxID=53633 RepID=A0A2T2WIE9_9FIRM|nr:MAG: hypothetical protein C7B45_08360 [Sulfobacillus acidophilus]